MVELLVLLRSLSFSTLFSLLFSLSFSISIFASSLNPQAPVHVIKAKDFFDLVTDTYAVSEVYRQNSVAVEEALKSRTKWENPQLQIGQGTARVGSFGGKYRELTISQVVPLDGKRSLLKGQSEYLKRDVELSAKKTSREVTSEVISFMFTYLYNKHVSTHLLEREERLALIDKYMKLKKAASPKDILDREMIANKLVNLRLEIKKIESEMQLSQSYFRAFLPAENNFDLEVAWPSLEALTTIFAKLEGSESLNQATLENQKKIVEKDMQVAQRSWVPDFKLYYTENYQDQPLQDPNINSAFGLQVSLPIFNRGQNMTHEKRALMIAKDLDSRRLKMKENIQIENLKNQYDRSRATFLSLINSKVISHSEKSLHKTTQQFKLGLIPALSYLEFDDQVHMSIHLMARARLEMIQSLLEIYSLKEAQLDMKDELL